MLAAKHVGVPISHLRTAQKYSVRPQAWKVDVPGPPDDPYKTGACGSWQTLAVLNDAAHRTQLKE